MEGGVGGVLGRGSGNNNNKEEYKKTLWQLKINVFGFGLVASL